MVSFQTPRKALSIHIRKPKLSKGNRAVQKKSAALKVQKYKMVKPNFLNNRVKLRECAVSGKPVWYDKDFKSKYCVVYYMMEKL